MYVNMGREPEGLDWFHNGTVLCLFRLPVLLSQKSQIACFRLELGGVWSEIW